MGQLDLMDRDFVPQGGAERGAVDDSIAVAQLGRDRNHCLGICPETDEPFVEPLEDLICTERDGELHGKRLLDGFNDA